jgi:hypothetical protein
MFSPVDVIKVDFFVVDALELDVLGARPICLTSLNFGALGDVPSELEKIEVRFHSRSTVFYVRTNLLITATFFESQGWPLYTGLTILFLSQQNKI